MPTVSAFFLAFFMGSSMLTDMAWSWSLVSLKRSRSSNVPRRGRQDDELRFSSTEPLQPPSPSIPQRFKSQLRLKSGRMVTICSRTVVLTENSWNVTIWEWDQPAALVEHYWNVQQLSPQPPQSSRQQQSQTKQQQQELLDPFGLVSWPGAVVAAQELQARRHHIQNNDASTVLILGAGTGVEAQAVAMLGAKRVIATDIHPTTLLLLQHGAQQAGLDHIITTQVLDLCSEQPLPACDILIVADVLYNPKLGAQVGRRCWEALQSNPFTKILVTDSQRFQGTDFLPILNQRFQKSGSDVVLEWEERTLDRFTGSGVMIDEDQTYSVVARVLSIGW